MPTEKRLITFSEREVHEAIFMLPTAARAAALDENVQIRLGAGTSVNVKLAGETNFEVTEDKVGAALLLFCKGQRIPIPRQGRKTLRRDEAGITMIIDVAEALLSNSWEIYDTAQGSGSTTNPGTAKTCQQCGQPIPPSSKAGKRRVKAS